jgi:virginiamycin B lyase
MQTRTRREALALLATAGALFSAVPGRARADAATVRSWPLATRQRTGIHDVAPAPDGGVWFTAQRSGHLGWFDPQSARVELVALGQFVAARRDPGA